MATYDQLETSVESSRPIELYTFAIGSASYYFTSAQDSITIGSDTWTAYPISRSDILQGLDARRQELKIIVPGNNSVAALYKDVPPSSRGTLTVIRVQRDETPSLQQRMIFKGRIKSVQFSEDNLVATIVVQSLESSLQRQMPTYVYSGMCNHIVYSSACGSNPALHNIIVAATSVATSGLSFTMVGSSSYSLVGGYVKPNSLDEFRLITAQSGDVVTILLPFTINIDGLSMQAFEGCDHLVDGDCANLHDRVSEFGGFAWVPNKNLFESGL